VSLLSKHGISTDESILKMLEDTPLAWNNLKKKTVVTKEKQAKNQSREADKLKKESKEFEDKVTPTPFTLNPKGVREQGKPCTLNLHPKTSTPNTEP